MPADNHSPYVAPSADLTVDDDLGNVEELEPLRGSPLSFHNLWILYTNPTRFFVNRDWLARCFEIIGVAFLAGVIGAQNRIDAKLSGLDISGNSARSAFAGFVADSWVGYFGFSLLMGMMSGVILWFVAGWWYHARLELSGAAGVPIRQARQAYQYQNLVQTLPSLLFVLLLPLQYSSYSEYWEKDLGLSALVLVVFAYWSCVTSYRAARTFPVTVWKARFWFLVLPVIFYTMVLGVVGTLAFYLENITT